MSVAIPMMEGGVDIVIPIVDDILPESTESFDLRISNVNLPGIIGENCLTRITILDDGKFLKTAFDKSSFNQEQSFL